MALILKSVGVCKPRGEGGGKAKYSRGGGEFPPPPINAALEKLLYKVAKVLSEVL